MRMQRDVTLLKTSVTLLQRDVKLRHTDCRALAAKHGVHDNSDVNSSDDGNDEKTRLGGRWAVTHAACDMIRAHKQEGSVQATSMT